MVALLIGIVLALVALAYVLHPLFVEPLPVSARARHARPEPSARDEAVAALREVEFDRETGKLSDSDYAVLKGRYTDEALAAMRAEGPELSLSKSGGDARSEVAARGSAAVGGGSTPGDAGASIRPVSDDAVEAEIRRAREHVPRCAVCGPRPEPDATYCSTCGRYLPGRCDGCGAPAEEPGARYCASCGHTLAA